MQFVYCIKHFGLERALHVCGALDVLALAPPD